MSKQYKDEVNKKALAKTKEIYTLLPDYIVSALRSRENVVSERTGLAYAQDLLLFCKYLKLCCQNKEIAVLSNTYRQMARNNINYEEVEPMIEKAGKGEIKDLPLSLFEILRPDDIINFLSYLSLYVNENGKELTNGKEAKRRKLASIREMYKYFCSCGFMQNNPASLVATPVEKRKKEIRALSYDEKTAIVEKITNTEEMTPKEKEINEFLRERDLAILFLFLSTGIRLSELVSLDISDINLDLSYFHVVGKGNKYHLHYFNDQCRNFLRDYYYNHRDKLHPDPDEPAFFLSRRGTRISLRSVEYMINKYSEKALGKDLKISPHKLRSTYGTDLLRQTGDISLVAENLSHSDISTSKRYYSKVGKELLKKNKDFSALEIP